MTLTAGERTAVANEVEAQIIDETDSERVLTAITDKIASVNPSLSGLTLGAIASAVAGQTSIAAMIANVVAILADTGELQSDWADGGRLDLLLDAVKTKTDGLPADPADASDLAASFGSINTTLGQVKAKTDTITAAPTVVQIRQEMDANSTKLANLDVAVSTVSTGGLSAADIASAVRDVSNASPPDGSLGAEVKAAAAGSGSGSGGVTAAEIVEALYDSFVANTTTFRTYILAIGAESAGTLTESVDHTTSTFSDLNDPDTIRVTSVNTATTRMTTVH